MKPVLAFQLKLLGALGIAVTFGYGFALADQALPLDVYTGREKIIPLCPELMRTVWCPIIDHDGTLRPGDGKGWSVQGLKKGKYSRISIQPSEVDRRRGILKCTGSADDKPFVATRKAPSFLDGGTCNLMANEPSFGCSLTKEAYAKCWQKAHPQERKVQPPHSEPRGSTVAPGQ